MADLDDFFAKKDRKKSKSKKGLTNEELAKKLEDTSKKVEVKVRKDNPTAADAAAAVPEPEETDNPEVEETPKNDDEWKEFEEEERKDYTGLKIGQMQIIDDDSNTGTDGEGLEYGSDGEFNAETSDQKSGPWKKMADKNEPAAAAPVVVEKPQPSKTYVSPALRAAQEQQKLRLKKGVLPDIHNEEYFPTLGSAKPEETKKKPTRPDPGFEEVRHGGRIQRSNDLPTNAPVSIGNRFTSLVDM